MQPPPVERHALCAVRGAVPLDRDPRRRCVAAARPLTPSLPPSSSRPPSAAMQVFYYQINSTDELGADQLGVDDYEWKSLVDRGLLGGREARWLTRCIADQRSNWAPSRL